MAKLLKTMNDSILPKHENHGTFTVPSLTKKTHVQPVTVFLYCAIQYD
jgi:hypothetical protein